MANHIKVVKSPHINKDGSESSSKFDWVVKHRRRRGGTAIVGTFTTKKAAESEVIETRKVVIENHLADHPNDKAFQKKHKIGDNQ